MDNYVHIAIGDSAYGILKTLLKSNDQSKYYGLVKNFSEDLSIGSIYELENNIDKRVEWFNKILTIAGYSELIEDNYIDIGIESTYTSELDIASKSKLIIWHGENALEQTSLRYLVNRFRDHDIYEVSVSKKVKKEFKGKIYIPRATAECNLEELGKALKSKSLIDEGRKEILISEWNELRKSEAKVRIYKGNRILSEDETYYDKYILRYASNEFLRASRIIGAVMGNCDQLISDTFIDYRIRVLIEAGKLEYRGRLRFMREFDIRLKY